MGKEYGGAYFLENTAYFVWRCLGCHSVVLEERYNNDGMHDGEGEDVWDSSYHPRREERHVRKKFFISLPPKLAAIYAESLLAFNTGTLLLSAVGLRSLIEGVCGDKGITGRDLKAKINGLAALLPKNIVENLHAFRFMGNTATHRLTPPTERDLRLAIGVCEDLLNFLYELDYKASQLGKQGKPSAKPKQAGETPPTGSAT